MKLHRTPSSAGKTSAQQAVAAGDATRLPYVEVTQDERATSAGAFLHREMGPAMPLYLGSSIRSATQSTMCRTYPFA